jgi:hypothetical protein
MNIAWLYICTALLLLSSSFIAVVKQVESTASLLFVPGCFHRIIRSSLQLQHMPTISEADSSSTNPFSLPTTSIKELVYGCLLRYTRVIYQTARSGPRPSPCSQSRLTMLKGYSRNLVSAALVLISTILSPNATSVLDRASRPRRRIHLPLRRHHHRAHCCTTQRRVTRM